MIIITIPNSQRSIFRVKDLLEIVLMETLFIINLLSIEELRSAMSNSLRLTLCITGRPNTHHRRCHDE